MADLAAKKMKMSSSRGGRAGPSAGPSGPISSGPTNQAAITAWEAGVETIRARICNILTKV